MRVITIYPTLSCVVLGTISVLQLAQIFEQAFKKRKDIQGALSHYGVNAKKIAKVTKVTSFLV